MPRRVLLTFAVASAAAIAGCSASPGSRTALQAAAPSVPAATTGPAAASPTITATGQGSASGAPDLLTVMIGVQTNGATAHGVLQTNNAEASALIAKLRADGVAAPDIQTAELSLNPVYSNDQPLHVSGYQATDTVVVRVHQLGNAGSILDDAVAAGGADSQVQSVSYSVENTGRLLAAAHADAVRQAEEEAKAMATAAGVTLGPLKGVTDASAPQVVPYELAPRATASGAAASVPVQPGTEKVTAAVTVTYTVG